MITYRQLTIYSLASVTLNDVVSFRSEPHTVVEIVTSKAKAFRRLPRRRRPVLAVKLTPNNGGKDITVSRSLLQRRASAFDAARTEARKITKTFKEGFKSIHFWRPDENKQAVRFLLGNKAARHVK